MGCELERGGMLMPCITVYLLTLFDRDKQLGLYIPLPLHLVSPSALTLLSPPTSRILTLFDLDK